MPRVISLALFVSWCLVQAPSHSAAQIGLTTHSERAAGFLPQGEPGAASGSRHGAVSTAQAPGIRQDFFSGRHRKGFHVTPNISWGVSNLKFKSEHALGELRADKGPATQFGIDVSYMFGAHAGIGLGCRAERFGYHAARYPSLDNKLTQSYFALPFYARFVSSKSRIKEPGFFTNIGLAYHALTSITDIDGGGGKHTSMEGYNSSVWSFQLCAGLSIPVSRQVSIDAGVDYQYFLSDNFDDTFISSIKSHLHAISGRVGVDIWLTQ